MNTRFFSFPGIEYFCIEIQFDQTEKFFCNKSLTVFFWSCLPVIQNFVGAGLPRYRGTLGPVSQPRGEKWPTLGRASTNSSKTPALPQSPNPFTPFPIPFKRLVVNHPPPPSPSVFCALLVFLKLFSGTTVSKSRLSLVSPALHLHVREVKSDFPKLVLNRHLSPLRFRL